MTDFSANPETVLAILQERTKTDPYIRELVRGAILEAALLDATREEPDEEPSASVPE